MKHTSAITAIGVGAFLSGVACVLVRQSVLGRPLSVQAVMAGREVRYGTVTLVWLIAWGVSELVIAGLAELGPARLWLGGLMLAVVVALQAIFASAIPAAVFDRVPWWRALWHGLREFARHPISILSIVIPISAGPLAFSIVAAPVRVTDWLMATMPEAVVLLVVGRLLIWLLADTLLTVSIAQLWWVHRAAQPAMAVRSSATSAAKFGAVGGSAELARQGPASSALQGLV